MYAYLLKVAKVCKVFDKKNFLIIFLALPCIGALFPLLWRKAKINLFLFKDVSPCRRPN